MNRVKTIFVIEDSRILSEIIVLQLKREFKCKVFVFKNGDDIINQMTKYSPDLIVLDYNFNDIQTRYDDGLKILIKIRKSYNTPVIVFSGQSDKQKALEIIRHGANDYISKDDDDFMMVLCDSVKDVFEIQLSRRKMKKLKRNFINGFILSMLFLLIAFSVFNYLLG